MDVVLNWMWQGAVVAVALSIMLVVLRRTRASLRYVLCWCAALAVLSLPVLSSFPSAPSAEIVGVPRADAIVALPDAWWTSSRVILAAASAWACFHLVRLLSAIAAVRRARRRSRRFPAHVEAALPHWRRLRHKGRRATLVLSNEVTHAAVLGWGAPVIAVAPSLVRTLDAADLDRVLVHEWAHVQRRDDVIGVLQITIRLVAGWHPALWWIERRLHVEREMACDETTVAIAGAPKSYAACLMKLSGMNRTPRRLHAAPAVFTRSHLRARVVKIVTPARPIAPMVSCTLAGAMVLALGLVSAAVGGVTLVEAAGSAAPAHAVTRLISSLVADRPAASLAPASPEKKRQRVARRVTAAPGPLAADSKPDQPAPLPPMHVEPVVVIDEPPVAIDEPPVALPARRLAQQAAQKPAEAAAEARSPWAAAASGGAAIGRTSKDAGVATAGFFSRFGRRVAGSFQR